MWLQSGKSRKSKHFAININQNFVIGAAKCAIVLLKNATSS